MSATIALIDALQKGVKLWVEGGRLRCWGPQSVLTPSLREELLQHKEELIDLLHGDSKYLLSSFAQQRLWFLDQLDPGSFAYNIPAAARLSGRLDVIALKRSLDEIVRRHEALRTTFAAVEGQAVQIIAPARAVILPVVDVREIPEAEREAEARRLAVAEAEHPFDLVCGPLMRATLLWLGEDEHVLLLTMHHIVSDAWSSGVLIRELGLLYQAFTNGEPSPLPELPIQYADFAIWQRQWLQGEVLEGQLAYWKQRLEGTPEVLELPITYPRPTSFRFRGARQSFALPEPLTEALRVLSQEEKATLFMTLLAAFEGLLYRYTEQEDIVVGSPIANRNWGETEGLIGFFVNTLVLRTDLSGNPSFRELLRRVREMTLGAYAHQDLPFEALVEELQPERDLSRSPLFQVMFVLQDAPVEALDLPDLTLSPLKADSRTAKFDLTLSMIETAQGLAGSVEYNTDLFDAATIARLKDHFQVLLEGVVADPDQRIADVPILTEAERQQLLVAWNDTETEYPRDVCIHELFEAQVEKTPDAVAVVFPSTGSGHGEDQHLTYRELNQRANQLAHHLQGLGVGPEVLVGICTERSLEMVIGLYGILKAGGAYVPLDPTYPRERLAFMMADAQVSVLLTQEKLVPTLSAHKVQARPACSERSRGEQSRRLVYLDTGWETIAQRDTQNPVSGVVPSNLAYVIYTSGSTGKPKGAMNTHAGIRNRLLWMQDAYQLVESDRVMQKTPFSFDVSVWEFFWPLLIGACLVVVRPEGHKDSAYLVRVVVEPCVTTMHFVPSMLQMFVEEQGVEACSSLKRVICSGEALPFDLQERFFVRLGAALHNLYGPTEAAVDVTFWPCERESKRRIVPIGRPIANTQIYLLGAHLQPVPIGVPGELHIGGDGLARGYHGRPDLTAEKFIPNPFSDGSGARLYKTGDLARYLPDGNIEFLGRIDHQVKVRGFRIELGEIEAVLAQHPAVGETVVLAREDEPGDKRLVAYIVPNDGQEPALSELRHFLREKLPEYMVPSAFVTLEALPLTPNGKVDRRALPAPEGERPELAGEYVAPRTPVEEILAGIWAQVIGVERVGVHDNFFDLGGHSLLATQVISHTRDAFQVELPLRTLFESPTVESMAAEIARRKGEQQDVIIPLPTIVPALEERNQPFPLTDVQQAYWIGRSEAFELGNVATHAYAEYESVGLDLERFELAWQRLIERHDMLRAIVRPDGQQQILEQVPPYRIEVLDLRGQERDTVVARLEAVREEMSHQVLPSDQWPLFDIRASCLDKDRVRLHISADALIGDAWSWQILGRELALFYQDPEASLAPLELSFRDYVLAELALRETELYQRSLAYWRDRLPTLPPAPDLPLAMLPASISKPRFVRRRASLEPEVWHRLRTRATRSGLTPSGVLLAAFAEVLTVWSKGSRFTINLTLFNRLPLHPQVNDVVGDFTSLTLLEVDNSIQDGFEARARRLRERLWEDLDHRYVSGVRVLRELAQARRGEGQTMMPIVFTSVLGQAALIQETAAPFDLEMSNQRLADEDDGEAGAYSISQTPQVWLDHQVSEQGEALVFNWDAVEDLFPTGLLDEMFDAYCCLLHHLADEETAWQATTHELVPVPVAQLEQRAAVNTTEASVSEELLLTLFAAQAQERPDQPAVIATDRVLTYEELQRRANQVGHWLRERSAQPNQLVAVVMEKGWEQVVAVLGILNSGAAYLPVAADLPQERIAYLLEHGEVDLALTQSWVEERVAWPEGIQRLCVDGDALKGVSEESLKPVQGVGDLAYVTYTSGSTGLPKGVMIDHRGAVNTILDVNQRFGVGPEDRMLALSSLGFDLSVYDVFGTLAAGGTIVMPDEEGRRDPAHWAELVARERVTVWNSVPALMEMLVDYAGGRAERLADSLRLVMMSGDWIPVTLPERIRALADGVELISLGGATEASIWSILYPIGEVDPEWKSIPYGKPMLNQTFHVLDEALEPRPVWVPGQLYIGGVGLAKGYWRDEEKTAASFIVHPKTGDRLYRTGDLGRYLPDGNIEFLGREDFQVKIRGHRIELGEIESTLVQHPAVQACVVTAAGDPRGDKRLVAYAVPDRAVIPVIKVQSPSPDGLGLQDYEPPQVEGALVDPVERLKFKLSHPGLRRDGTRSRVSLSKFELDEILMEEYTARRSYRKFVPQIIPFEQFSRFLSCLAQVDIDGVPLPKYRYASAGALYPVQTYLYVKPERVEEVAGGTYYYDPQEHNLVLLAADARINSTVYPPGDNRSIFEASAFSIYLVGQMSAISPMYGEWARDFCMLEAGLMTQLLETSGPRNQIGLCQIGGFDFEPIRHWFVLGESHMYLHSLLGGRIDAGWARPQALVEDSRDVLTFLELVQQELGDGSVTKVTSPRTPPCAEEPAPDGAVVEELRGFLQERLPAYMVPSTFVLLDALPLTPNGKVDRRALPEPDMAGVEQEKTFVAPQTDLERTIASIWQEVLQVERVSVHDSFFDLGGNSVHVVQVYNKLRELMGEDLPIVKMFEYPTIHSLARYMVQGQDKRSFLQQERERARTRRELREQRRQTRRGRRATRDS